MAFDRSPAPVSMVDAPMLSPFSGHHMELHQFPVEPDGFLAAVGENLFRPIAVYRMPCSNISRGRAIVR
jgi:hypothetical protein